MYVIFLKMQNLSVHILTVSNAMLCYFQKDLSDGGFCEREGEVV